MINVLICGINTDMGRSMYEVAERNGINVVCGVDKTISDVFNCPVYNSYEDVREMVDFVIDVSSPDMLDMTLGFVKENNYPLIEGTTGYSFKQKEELKKAGEVVPVFMSYNLSLGVNVLFRLCVETAKVLRGYDIEIVERYNAKKINTPGSTTLNLANELNEALGGNMKIIIGRTSLRKSGEICLHCIRGGNVDSQHDVLFIGEKETITISHITEDNALYAEGAVMIVNFLKEKKNGFITMKDYFTETF